MLKQGYNYHKQTKQPLRRLAAKTSHFNIFCVTWFDLFFLYDGFLDLGSKTGTMFTLQAKHKT